VPELPEVETVRRGLERQLGGFVVDRVEVLRSRTIAAPRNQDAAFKGAIEGCQLGAWRRRGKYLIASLQRATQAAGEMGVHLRMTGHFQWLSKVGPPPCVHTRVRFIGTAGTGEGMELRFVDMRSFGELWFVPTNQPTESVITGLQRLGPEPFSKEFSPAHLRRRLQGSSRPIKNALLDQGLVAGVGNIYADESLFLAGIRPHTPSGRLSLAQLSKLHHSLVEVLELSIGAGGTSFSDFRDLSGSNGNYGGVAWVYRRGGEPCRRCGTSLNRDKLGGRSSHWCPKCQG
jgi:formamidopyrimidine-DNA glycosylase